MMPKKEKKPQKEEDVRTQRQRFEDAAREAEADKTGEEFEKAFKKIAPRKSNRVPTEGST